MTSNQLAYQSNQENQRHNTVVEAETTRHNGRAEELEGERNAIDAKWKENDAWYKTQLVALQQEYNREYLRLQKSQGDEKNRIQAVLADIEDQKRRTTAWYNEQKVQIEEQQNRNTEKYNEELALHNRNIERINQDFNAATNLWRNKQLEYERTQWREQNNIAWGNVNAKAIENTLRQQELQWKRYYENQMLDITRDKTSWANAESRQKILWWPMQVMSNWVPGVKISF